MGIKFSPPHFIDCIKSNSDTQDGEVDSAFLGKGNAKLQGKGYEAVNAIGLPGTCVIYLFFVLWLMPRI